MTTEPTPIDSRTPTLRRPPAAPSRWATVTKLGVGATDVPQPVPDTATRDGFAARTDGALALAARPVPRPGAGLPETPELRLLPPTRPGRQDASDDVRLWAARFAQGVVEVLGGDRPLSQLVRWTSQRVYADLGRRLRILSRTTAAEDRARLIRPQVRSVHVFHPTPETAEVSVHVRHGQRSRALAARLEQHEGRWQCTALQLG